MEFATAKEIMGHIGRVNEALNDVARAIEQISETEERRTFRKAFAETVVDVYEKLMVPIIRSHPALDPDK
jgi:hypothetical protein